jgi:branched-chain amino acid transport system substrate-binding protein
MYRFAIAAGVALALAGSAAAQELRIGFLNTTTGQGAILGKHIENGWKLGLEHEGWRKDGDKLGGVATRIFYGDDQTKPDVGLREVEKFLVQDRVQLVTGVLWSNVMMAIAKPIFDARAGFLSVNAGASPIAGNLCNRLFASTSWPNDITHEAAGELVQREGVKTVVVLAPNYQAGKDSVAGFSRFYKGKVVDAIFFKLGESDFQADIAKVRAHGAEAVFLFAPGAMGISFVKQWASSGMARTTKLYSAFSIDYATLPAMGEAALGSILPIMWNQDIPGERNAKFVKDYVAKFGSRPSNFSAQAYDAPATIAGALKSLGGKFDGASLIRAIRTAPMPSVRGDLKYNVNGMPIQPFYKAVVVRGDDGKPMIKTESTIWERPDQNAESCPVGERI